MEQLADERARGHAELVRRLRYASRQRLLRRARSLERTAERRLIEAWRRAEVLRTRAGMHGD